ncbi:hypothetical protein [Embleya sp. NBC_00896]|uniref:hypothetical protein n=1 Tax=Embleya sp. NBC_00896 TaxID=2975961 RepID=UPI0038686583|nr:hypothetical protein OG928_42780 [Embleya sp. NBC_00896]
MWFLTAALIALVCAALVAWTIERADHGSRGHAAPSRGATPSGGPRTDGPDVTGSPTEGPRDGDAKVDLPTDPEARPLILNIDGRPVLTDLRDPEGPPTEIPVRDIGIEAISPDARRVAGNVLAADGKPGPGLRVESLDGSHPVDFAPKDGAYIQPEFSVDGSTLFFTHTADPGGVTHFGARIMSVPADGGSAPKQLFDDANEFCDSTFSASRVGLYSFSRAERITEDASWPDSPPKCGATGGVLALYNEKDGSIIDVPRPEGLPPVDPFSAISPDGKRLAVVSVVTHSIHLYVLDLDSGELNRIPGNATNGGGPFRPIFGWSPDGDHIAIDHQDPGRTLAYDSRTGETTAAWPTGSRTPVWLPERSS